VFKELPADLPRLVELIETVGDIAVPCPPDLMEEAVRLRIIYTRARSSGYANLPAFAWRKLPYAYWMRGAAPLDEVEPELVEQYWRQHLPAAASMAANRTKRWLTPLFHTYCERFAPEEEAFAKFAANFRGVLERAAGPLAEQLRRKQQALSFFSPSEAPARLAARLSNPNHSLDQILNREQFWPGFLTCRLGNAAYASALKTATKSRADPEQQLRLIDWAQKLGVDVVQTEHRVSLAEALLLPWAEATPPDLHRARITDYLLKRYGHPKKKNPQEKEDPQAVFRWRGVSDRAGAVLNRWLDGDTIRIFVHVLEKTADKTWSFRRRFWMAYYDAGYIDAAWLALGPEALERALEFRQGGTGIEFGKLEGIFAQNQSVLLLRIGSLVFAEWSHKGSLRAFEEGSRGAPRLYLDSYDGASLRESQSLDFHGGLKARPQLFHWHSESGWWQRTARDFIRRQTGIQMSDRDIL
jgi:hypothetical protein